MTTSSSYFIIAQDLARFIKFSGTLAQAKSKAINLDGPGWYVFGVYKTEIERDAVFQTYSK